MSEYKGSELELFQHARNWKEYFSGYLKKFIGNEVLEVGAGIGETTRFLSGNQKTWLCLEPDANLSTLISQKVNEKELPSFVEVQNGTIKDLNPNRKFDTLLYIDVLEHIEDDQLELELIQSFLKENGHLIILVPAFQYLFSEFDKAIGHYRRYNKKLLKLAIPTTLKPIQIRYLDSLGFFSSVANKLILKQPYPTLKQIALWDNFLIPFSKVSDKIVFHSFGKSLIGVWRKTG